MRRPALVKKKKNGLRAEQSTGSKKTATLVSCMGAIGCSNKERRNHSLSKIAEGKLKVKKPSWVEREEE